MDKLSVVKIGGNVIEDTKQLNDFDCIEQNARCQDIGAWWG